MPPRIPVRSASLARQVLEILIEQIMNGDFPPGSQLPPENKLASEFNVSRATVRSAMSALAARGLVVRRHGVGTFVSQLSRISNPLNEATDFYDLITRQGYEFGTQFVSGVFVKPDADVSQALQIEQSEDVLRTHKIFTADGDPVIYSINSIPRWVFGDDLAQQVAAQPEITEPLYAFLEQRCNQRTEYHVAKIRPDIAENCEMRGLTLDPITAVLVMEEIGYNRAEHPLWHSFVYFPGGFVTFEVIRHRQTRS